MRNVVVIRQAVANGMEEICTHGRRVREDLNHPDWDGLPTLPEASPLKTKERALEFAGSLEEVEGVIVTPPKETLPLVLEENLDGNIQETLEHPPEPQQALPAKTPADMLGPPNGPLRVVSSSGKSGPGGTYKIHLLTTENKAVGCGWQPSIDKAQDLNPLDHRSEPHCYQECARCFRLFGFPTDSQRVEEDSELSSSSADSLTDDSVDTASETEKVTAEILKSGCTKWPYHQGDYIPHWW